jgi:PAS domain S-box-containing protein
MPNFWEKRLKREIAAREQAEKILEEKSKELFLKNKELATVNSRLNETLELRVAELKESEFQRFTLFENSVMGVALTLHGKILKVNNTFAQMLGYDIEEVVGKFIPDISYKDDAEPSMEHTEDLQEGNMDNFVLEKRYKRRNNTLFWARTHVSAVKDEDGNIKYHFAIIENIHEKKIAERKTEILLENLKEVNESLENFAHIVSHDLKSPITGINTILNWLESFEFDQQVVQYHDMMKGLVLKMYNLIDSVIAYSKVNATDETREVFDVRKLLDESLQFLPIPNNMKVTKTGNFPKIRANKAKMQQVFSNLVDNAIKYANKEGATIDIKSLEDKDYWIFKVRDNGSGIKEKYFTKIFQIFQTIDSKNSKGTGIGLTLVSKIIKQYKGSITVDSKLNEFTEFTFSLAKSETKV